MARKKGEGLPRGVFERPKGSGNLWIRWTDQDGHEHREEVGIVTPEKAARAYAKRRVEVKRAKLFPKPAPKSGKKLAEIISEYLKESRANKRSWRDDVRYALVWTEYFGAIDLEDVTRASIKAWRRKKQLEHKSPATINRHIAFLKRVFNVAMEDELTERNPARIRFLTENNTRVRWLRPAEEAELRKHLTAEQWDVIDLALQTGMRQAEQLSMRWEHIDFQAGIITVPRSKHGDKRFVQINPRVREILAALPSRMRSPWVYPAVDPEKHVHYSVFRLGWWQKALKKAKIDDFHWHDLRHTFATRLVVQKVDLVVIKELLGHKSISTTLRYTKVADEVAKEAVGRLVEKKSGPTGTKTDGADRGPEESGSQSGSAAS